MQEDQRITTKDGKNYEITAKGSLGLLALGYKGLQMWRAKREQIKNSEKEKQLDA